MWLVPCKIALVMVDREKNTTAAEPATMSLIRSSLSWLANSRLQIGSTRTLNPTAAGMAIIMEKRIAVLVLWTAALRSRMAAALARAGIRDDDRALARATGMLKSRWYSPNTPQRAAI